MKKTMILLLLSVATMFSVAQSLKPITASVTKIEPAKAYKVINVKLSLPTNCSYWPTTPLGGECTCECECWSIDYFVVASVPIIVSAGLTTGSSCNNTCSTTHTNSNGSNCGNLTKTDRAKELAVEWLLAHPEHDLKAKVVPVAVK